MRTPRTRQFLAGTQATKVLPAKGVEVDREFALEQFKQVRESLEGRGTETSDTIKYVLLGAAAVAAWVSTSTLMNSALRALAFVLPVLIILLGMLRVEGLRIQRRIHFDYLVRLERCLKDQHYGLMGFESFRRARLGAYGNKRPTRRVSKVTKREHSRLFSWLDERYLFLSFAVVFVVFAILGAASA